jgi:oligopeptide/dipeptide ABC transporter ATP-binding protein
VSERPLLHVEGLEVHFRTPSRQIVRAVDGVDFSLDGGETLGLVGESGSGKSTMGMSVLRRYAPAAGRISFEGTDIATLDRKQLREFRRHAQVVFQDPYASLNPRMTVGEIVGEPLVVHGIISGRPALRARVAELLEQCGLPASGMHRYPGAFSGGERQRIAIARALALNPKLVVADEAVSSLDVSVQAQIVNLLVSLQRERGLSYLFISHDLGVVRHIADRVMIMYLGKLMEYGPAEAIFTAPAHPYTQALLSAAPVMDPGKRGRGRIVLGGEVPSITAPPVGCRFNTRCPLAEGRCFEASPPLEEKTPGRWAACWRVPPLDG